MGGIGERGEFDRAVKHLRVEQVVLSEFLVGTAPVEQ
jgi:hypothetical protein